MHLSLLTTFDRANCSEATLWRGTYVVWPSRQICPAEQPTGQYVQNNPHVCCLSLTACSKLHAHIILLRQAVEDEAELMKSTRARLGPYASGRALLYHLRAARGKVFWAGMAAG